MADGPRGAVLKSIDTLFRVGTIGALTDAELIDLFLTRRDGAESAFETLVRRHGPMVFGVCRGVLNDPNDAEDAFQATFLVLARRAPSIRHKASMGSWLHGVAQRVALRARADAVRRRIHENRAADRVERREAISPESDSSSDDLARILHEELGRLPEKYRDPVLLCDGEGLTHEHAARRLGWPVGTVSGRLSRAHGLLRDRLKRRGVEPCSIVVGGAAVSSSVVGKTARAAVLFATQTGVPNAAGIATTIPAGAFALAKGVLRTMSITRTITAGVLIMAGVGFTTVGASYLAVRGQDEVDKPKAEIKPEAKKAPKSQPDPQQPASQPIMAEMLSKPAPNEDALKAIREAAKAAEGIQVPGAKLISLTRIAAAYAKAGDREAARSTYGQARSIVQATTEELKRQFGLARPQNLTNYDAILFPGRQGIVVNRAIMGLVQSQVSNGFLEDAAVTINQLYGGVRAELTLGLPDILKAIAQDGRIQNAVQLAEAFQDDSDNSLRESLLKEIAHIQAKDFPKTDRSWIDKLKEPELKTSALLGVAAGLAGEPYQPSIYRQSLRGDDADGAPEKGPRPASKPSRRSRSAPGPRPQVAAPEE